MRLFCCAIAIVLVAIGFGEAKQDVQKTQQQYQLEIDKLTAEIEKLRVEIAAQRKILESVVKPEKKEPVVDPKLPKLIIFAYSAGGLSGKVEESKVKDGMDGALLTHHGDSEKLPPAYMIPEEDYKELLRVSRDLVMVSPKRVYGNRGPDVAIVTYTVSLVGIREASVSWNKDGSKVPPELEKFDAKYREIYARSKPVK